MKRIPSLSGLRAFEAAARRRSFKLAAEELAVTPTAISHGIRALEEDLKTPLFVRKTRAVEVTAEGRALLAAVREGFDAIAAGVELLGRRRHQSVRLSTTPAFATKWLVPRLAGLHAEHPTIDLHVHASYEPVDLHARDVDLAIRYGVGRYQGLVSTLLMHDRFAPVASPALRFRPRSPARASPSSASCSYRKSCSSDCWKPSGRHSMGFRIISCARHSVRIPTPRPPSKPGC